MARVIGKLTAIKIEKAKRPGMYGDGGGLYLRVTDDGEKNWVFRFMLSGRPRWMGMGPFHTVNLAEARKRAGEHRLRRYDGIDPIEARRVTERLCREIVALNIPHARSAAAPHVTVSIGVATMSSDMTHAINSGQPGVDSTMEATQGGRISNANLTSLTDVLLAIDGTGTQDTTQITSFVGGNLTVSGGSPSFAGEAGH